jgi:peptidoglycan/LPS O-acetylase OafA/YrhL
VSVRGAALLWGAASLGLALWDPVVLVIHGRTVLFPISCALLLAALLVRPGRPLWIRATEPLGEFSYSLYLMHPVALAVLLKAPWEGVPVWLSMTVDVVAGLLLSGAFYWLVERHFARAPQPAHAREPRLYLDAA